MHSMPQSEVSSLKNALAREWAVLRGGRRWRGGCAIAASSRLQPLLRLSGLCPPKPPLGAREAAEAERGLRRKSRPQARPVRERARGGRQQHAAEAPRRVEPAEDGA